MKYVLMLVLSVMLASCQTSGRHKGEIGPATKIGAAIGGGLGGVVGHNKGGRTAEGVGIGAVVGGSVGYVIDKITGNTSEPKKQTQVYTEHPQDTITIKRRKTVIVEEEVPVHQDIREYYIDPATGVKKYIKR
tara:strand:- start:141 stop:539 length:399 start_codon:yes stop_codon:yes gene_type:complete